LTEKTIVTTNVLTVNSLLEKENVLGILVRFLERSILKVNYNPSIRYNEAIVLSETGEKILVHLKKQFALTDDFVSDGKLALLINSKNNIDLELTDVDKLIEVVSSEIIEKSLLYPYFFGRELYDKFFDLFNNNKELNEEDTSKLLTLTPIGVFQIGNILIGPFGVIKSTEIRYIPPTSNRNYPLWHSVDKSDKKLHQTSFKTYHHKIHDFLSEIRNLDSNLSLSYQFSIYENKNPYDLNRINSLVFLLGTFPTEELRLLFSKIIDCHKEIREYLPQREEFVNMWKGNGEKISAHLNHNQCLQLILLCKDEFILKHLEKLIFEGIIHIPETEIRRPKTSFITFSEFVIRTECSKYGFRSLIKINNETNTALIRLRNLIENLYSTEEEKQRLNWKLRDIEGNNMYEKLGKYLLVKHPRQIIVELVFDNSKYVHETFGFLKYGDFDKDLEVSKEDYYINKILWKLGFDISVYPAYQTIFWKRQDQFLKVLKSKQIYNEDDKELIRSAGVNYFVSLEEILDYGLSFITWTLLSDHYLTSNFIFNLEEAREFTAKVINENKYKINDTDFLVLDKDGKNTLYPLIKSFHILANICKEYMDSKEEYKRDESEYPDFYKKTEIYLFPFEHKKLLLDLNPDDVERIINLLNEISFILESNDVSNVRNRIKHNRPIHEFPKSNELETTYKAIYDVAKKMETEGILPTVYIKFGNEIDEFGRGFIKYKNYKSEVLLISNSSRFIKSGMPLYKKLQVCLPNVHIKNSIEKLRFGYLEKTEYSNYWSNYPKIKVKDEDIESSYDESI